MGGNRRILIGCDELPEYGEGGVAAYRLFETMVEDGLDVLYVNLVDDADAVHAQYALREPYGNPAGLEGVHNCRVVGSPDANQSTLERLLADLQPAIVLAIGERATSYLKRSFLDRRVICYSIRTDRGQERSDGIEIADLVVAGSLGSLRALCRDFPHLTGKIRPEPVSCAEWIARRAGADSKPLPLDEREIDLLFLAASWTDSPWNDALVRRVRDRIGSGDIRMEPVSSATERLALLGRTRTVVLPFVEHPGPPEAFEAAACGCNLILSKQCGNWSVCHPELLVDRPRTRAILSRIDRARGACYPARLADYLSRRGYDELVETLLAF